MIEVSHLPALSAGMFAGTVLLLYGVGFGKVVMILCLICWLAGQYITARLKSE